jgi:hypothetical protein
VVALNDSDVGCPILSKLNIFRHVLIKVPEIEFYENPSSRSRRLSMKMSGRINLRKPMVACVGASKRHL